jgi:predicted DsbA family dithiol-disulfide isomerase
MNVTRHPYSWAGDADVTKEKMGYGDMRQEKNMDEAPRTNPVPRTDVRELGKLAGIKFDFGVEMVWQPVESQRVVLWASEYGKQEEMADRLGELHFEENNSVADRQTLLTAVSDVGLDAKIAAEFLDSDVYHKDVWESYGKMIHYFGITEIPVFVFNRPGCPGIFTPEFVDGSTPHPVIVIGSATPEIFHQALTHIMNNTGYPTARCHL